MHIHKKKMKGGVTRARRRGGCPELSRRSPRTAAGEAGGGPGAITAIFRILKTSYVGRKRTCVRHVGEAASQPTWARRRFRSRVRAVLGPENKSPGSY